MRNITKEEITLAQEVNACVFSHYKSSPHEAYNLGIEVHHVEIQEPQLDAVHELFLTVIEYFAAGVLMGLPLSIHRKSYWPFAMAAVIGSAADFIQAQETCKPQREALERCIAHQKSLEEEQRQRLEADKRFQEDGRPQDGLEGSEFRDDFGRGSSAGGDGR